MASVLASRPKFLTRLVEWITLIQVIPWVVGTIVAALQVKAVLSDRRIPDELQPELSAAWTRMLSSLAVALAVSVLVVIVGRAWRRRCSDAPIHTPRPDLASVVEKVTGSGRSICRRPEPCEWAGAQCATVAAGELRKALQIIQQHLSGYKHAWDQDRNQGAAHVTATYQDMAWEAEENFHRATCRSRQVTLVCANESELSAHWAEAMAIVDDFRERVVGELGRTGGNPRICQSRAAQAVSNLLGRAEDLAGALDTWGRQTEDLLVSLRQRIVHVDI